MAEEKTTGETMAEKFIKAYPNPEKTKKENYLSPSRVLPESDYQKYREMKQQSERYRYLNKIKRLEKENKINRNRESYGKTRSGRFGKGIITATRFIRNPSRTLYSRRQPVSPQRKMQLQQMRIVQAARNQAQLNYNQIFSDFRDPRVNHAMMVEGEVSNVNGYANAGSQEAFNVDRIAGLGYGNVFSNLSRETNFHAHNSIVNPSLKTSQQVKKHSKNIVNDPLFNVSAEANIFSHILD